MSELFNRLRLAAMVLILGNLDNGNLNHLRAMLAELEYIETHQDDLSKEEILRLIISSKSGTGALHHLRHVLMSQNWRLVNAQAINAELIDLRKRVSVTEFKRIVRERILGKNKKSPEGL